MVSIKINGKRYRVYNLWTDLEIKHWIELGKLGPHKLHDPQYWDSVIPIFSDIPSELIKKISREDKRVLYYNYGMRDFCAGLWDWGDLKWKPMGTSHFYWRGIKWYLPESLEIGDRVVPGWKLQTRYVTEISNLMRAFDSDRESNVKLLPLLAAHFITPDRDEQYNEATIAQRAQLFRELPLTPALEVFFSIITYFTLYVNHILIYGDETVDRGALSHLITIAGLQ